MQGDAAGRPAACDTKASWASRLHTCAACRSSRPAVARHSRATRRNGMASSSANTPSSVKRSASWRPAGWYWPRSWPAPPAPAAAAGPHPAPGLRHPRSSSTTAGPPARSCSSSTAACASDTSARHPRVIGEDLVDQPQQQRPPPGHRQQPLLRPPGPAAAARRSAAPVPAPATSDPPAPPRPARPAAPAPAWSPAGRTVLPPSANGASCSGAHTSSRTSSRRGPASSSEPSCCPASCGSVNVASSPVTSLITSLTLAATAAWPRTSRPTVTRYTRPPNRRRTRRSAHDHQGQRGLTEPPAPYSPVVIPTVPAWPATSACTTASSSAGRPTTHPGTCNSGGTWQRRAPAAAKPSTPAAPKPTPPPPRPRWLPARPMAPPTSQPEPDPADENCDQERACRANHGGHQAQHDLPAHSTQLTPHDSMMQTRWHKLPAQHRSRPLLLAAGAS